MGLRFITITTRTLGKQYILLGSTAPKDVFSAHLTQVLKKQAQINLETIRVKNADATYSAPGDLRQMYNDLKAYVGRENEDTRLL